MSKNATESDQLTLFAADSHVNPSAAPESETEQQMTVISGRRCYERSVKLGRAGLLAKTLLASSRWTAGLYSTKYALRWKMKGIRSKRLLFQLAPSVRPTDGTGFGLLLPTPAAHKVTEQFTDKTEMVNSKGEPWKFGEKPYNKAGIQKQTVLADYISLLPTPNTSNGTGEWSGMDGGPNLQTVVALLPTPTARDHKGANSAEHCADGSHMNQLPNYLEHGLNTGYKLQPGFVEWMMGYPPGWTDIEPDDSSNSETP